MNRPLRSLLPGRRAFVALLLAHVLAVVALAASPELHHWLHGDADQDQDCAVELFLHGAAEGPTGPVPVPGFVFQGIALVPLVVRTGAFVRSTFAFSRVFEHGPPGVR